MSKIQHFFEIDLTINDIRDVRGIILDNKIKMVLISDKNINRSICSVGVGAGHLHDDIEGTAHFLEHLLFMGNEKYPESNAYSSYVSECGGSYNAFTSDNFTLYHLELDTDFLSKGIEMLSWFFSKPLLDMKHINSEKDIVNSEHEKNLLDDQWIMDDLFKYFIKSNSKYKKFGTGNNESLKNITKEDIFKFYNTYYTTCNICVCIIDSKSIDTMINQYVGFFNDIKPRLYTSKIDRFKKEKLNFNNDNNLIIFKSVSEYNYLIFNLIFEAEEKLQTDYQLVNLISWFIGTEYKDSLAYWLKEEDITKYLSCSIDYFYDLDAIMNIRFIINEPKLKTINIITECFNNLLNKMLNITESKFEELYENFQKIRLLNCMYSDNSDSLDLSIGIIENLIKSEPHMAILRSCIFSKYTKKIFSRYIEILNSLIIKIITNINFLNQKKFLKSKWYNTPYTIIKYDFDIDIDINSDKNNFKFNLMNLIGIKDFSIKTDLVNKKINKNLEPKLVNRNNLFNRKVYYLEHNKYKKPIANIVVMRSNKLILDNKNKLILYIYKNICKNILNYYLEVMNQYEMFFDIIIDNDCIGYNFNGLDWIINNFIFEILKYIHPDTIFNNPNTEKYFKKNIRNLKENISNSKYSYPYIRSLQIQSILLNDDLLPDEQLKFLNKLTFNEFKKNILECLKFESETYIIIGIPNLVLDKHENEHSYIVNENINYLIESLSLDPKRYFIQNNSNKITDIPYKLTYKFSPHDINKMEKNNCVIENFIISNIEIEYKDNILVESSIKDIIKYKLISQIISEILHEPLFYKVRTIDKLGYVVKCNSIYKNIGNNVIFIIYYLTQSNFKINDIIKSYNEFNTFISKDIVKNKNKYVEKFNSIKKSKELLFKKSFVDLDEEVSNYLTSFLEKFCIFNIDNVVLEVLAKINFDDITKGLKSFLKSSEKSKYIILDSTNKN
jgi:insulysin